MSRDYAEKEREFIESLKADTGRNLDEWMNAIGKQKFAHRNDAIDWLRQQGFLFAWASWLERIHNNGGRPIYCDEATSQTATAHRHAASPSEAVDATPPVRVEGGSVIPFPMQTPAETPTSPPLGQSSSPPSPAVSASPVEASLEVKAVIASAKAYAPLAGFFLRRVDAALPGTTFRTGRRHIEMLSDPLPFALIAVGGKDLKLAFAGPPGTFDAPVMKVKLPNLGAPLSPLLTHMIALTDARQIDDDLLESLRQARARVLGDRKI